MRKTGKKCAAVFGGSLGVPALTSSCQREKRRPKYCENDCSCGSPGLLGIGKCHKSQELGLFVQISQPTFQTPEVQMLFFFNVSEKQASFGTHLSTRLKLHILVIYPSFSYQECYLFVTGSSALLKTALILADKPVNSGNSDGLLDFFLESVLNLWWELLMTAAFFPLGLDHHLV